MAWKTLCREFLSKNYQEVPVVIENLSFKRITTLPLEGDVKFSINMVKKSGNFEILESSVPVCSGNIRTKEDAPTEFDILKSPIEFPRGTMDLTNTDIYRFFDLKGQIFSQSFKSVIETNVEASAGRVEWKDDFPSFIENMLQLSGLGVPNYNGFLFSSGVSKIVIDPVQFMESISENKGK